MISPEVLGKKDHVSDNKPGKEKTKQKRIVIPEKKIFGVLYTLVKIFGKYTNEMKRQLFYHKWLHFIFINTFAD